MSGTNFYGVNLADAQFYAVLTKAKFTDSNLTEAVFDDISLAVRALITSICLDRHHQCKSIAIDHKRRHVSRFRHQRCRFDWDADQWRSRNRYSWPMKRRKPDLCSTPAFLKALEEPVAKTIPSS
nr:pentapeptide repeat-containing protein [Rhizobium leguminosarum]